MSLEQGAWSKQPETLPHRANPVTREIQDLYLVLVDLCAKLIRAVCLVAAATYLPKPRFRGAPAVAKECL